MHREAAEAADNPQTIQKYNFTIKTPSRFITVITICSWSCYAFSFAMLLDVPCTAPIVCQRACASEEVQTEPMDNPLGNSIGNSTGNPIIHCNQTVVEHVCATSMQE